MLSAEEIARTLEAKAGAGLGAKEQERVARLALRASERLIASTAVRTGQAQLEAMEKAFGDLGNEARKRPMAQPMADDKWAKALGVQTKYWPGNPPLPEEIASSPIEGLKSVSLLSSQFITLATAITTLTVTFWDKFRDNPSVPATRYDPILWAWVLMLLAIVSALLTQHRVVDALSRHPTPDNSIWRWRIRGPAYAMVVFFVVGLGLLACISLGLLR